MHGYDARYPLTVVRSGLALIEGEIDITAHYRMTGDGLPLIEDIGVWGVPVDEPNKWTCRELALSDPLWEEIATWLVDERSQDMADNAQADAWAEKGGAA